MCTPTKPSRGGADSWDGGGGDDDGVIIFAGGIDFQGTSSYKSRHNLKEVTITMHRVLLTSMRAERKSIRICRCNEAQRYHSRRIILEEHINTVASVGGCGGHKCEVVLCSSNLVIDSLLLYRLSICT